MAPSTGRSYTPVVSMEEQLREHLKAIYKKFDDQEKRNNERFEELMKIIRDTKEASTSGSVEACRKITDNLDANPVHRAETATNIGGNIHPRTL